MRLFYLIISFGLCAISCTPPATKPETPKLILDSKDIRLILTPGYAPVETPLVLTLNAEGLTAVTGKLIGISMYMGIVPLRFSQITENQWQAEFLLGACSDPDMQWQLELELILADGEKRTLIQQFQSSWR